MKYLHNDTEAIYTRGALWGFKNWNRKWAAKLAAKYAASN